MLYLKIVSAKVRDGYNPVVLVLLEDLYGRPRQNSQNFPIFAMSRAKSHVSHRSNIQTLDTIDCQSITWQLMGIVMGIGSWQIIAIIDWFFSEK